MPADRPSDDPQGHFPEDSAEAMVSAFITLVTDVDRTPAYRARTEGSAGRPLPRSAISILFVLHRHGPSG